MSNYSGKLQQLLSLLTCVLLVMAVSIRRDGKVVGRELKQQQADSTKTETMVVLEDGSVRLNTTELGKDIIGYGGTVPLEIILEDGRVKSIKALENSETPDFFKEASAFLTKWNGHTVAEAQKLKVDAVSGATFSSKAIIGNVQRGLQYAAKNPVQDSIWAEMDFSSKAIAGLIIVLLAAIVPLFVKDRRYRISQQILNVIVLGFWCGTFISYALMVGYLANGVNVWASLIPIMMLVTAFIYPLFGKKNYYCTNICPCGSLQELAGKINKRHHWRMSTEVAQALSRFREILWAVLLMLMLLDVTFKWMDYEVFSAFIIQSASWSVLVLGIVFLILSFFVPRPYCRFLCPTGTLFKVAQNSKL